MAPREPASPNKLRIPASLNRNLSLSESSLRRKSSYLQDLITRQNHNKGYDREYKEALLNGEVGNGVRTWYSSFTTIGELNSLDSLTAGEMRGNSRAIEAIVKALQKTEAERLPYTISFTTSLATC